MIIKEQEIKNTLKAKGKLVGIDDDGLHIEDPKSHEVEVLSLDELKIFRGRTITISVADSKKTDIEVEEDEEDQEENEEEEE
ncbi:MAG: hypothetical protein ACOYI4_01815 [Christensenellales bacterium]|jgi:hypothetical protein